MAEGAEELIYSTYRNSSGAMVGVSAVVSTFCTFLIGTASDRLGRRRPFIAFGYILWGVFTIGFGVTEFLPKDPLWLAATCVVLADAVMSFFGSMGNDGAFNPWTTDISSAGNRGKVGGALAVMPVFATIFGAIVSGIIIDALDFFAFFTIMGGMVIAVGVLCLFTLRDAPGLAPNRDPRGFWHQFAAVFDYKIVGRNRELFWVFLVMMVYFIGFNVYFPYITVYFTDNLGMDYTLTGVVQGAGLLAASVLTIPAARFIDRGKCGPVIAAAVGCNLLGLLGVSFSTAFVPLLIGVFGAGAGYILVLQARSGRAALVHRLELLGYDLTQEELDDTYGKFLELADKKKEIHDYDLLYLVGDIDRMKQQSVSLKFLQVTTGTLVPTATVVLKFGDHERMAIATGNGPVDAAVSAIKTLINEKVVLMEFLMQAITRGSNDVGRVHVQVQCGSRTVHGFAAHTDTTRASIEAFLDALRVLNVTERKEKEE